MVGGVKAAAAAAAGSWPACEYVDPANEKRYPLADPRWCGEGKTDAGGPRPLMLTDLAGITREQIDTKRRSLWRYAGG